ncbi:amidohydrolase [Leucobacter sp. UT-8R-CII-1-4]|uniref:amidohydrolase n=1 Tax=Leucobacter sp. UT-8R-CII-1-4 TaxID=3040075 RepID=UPI0024A8BAF6|nr:amidohydrolase [Leucobacter sp. UT-8R-CII-1-4]MDI6022440.1 amidohydrolase [Leucobacter sp. UT-8R-CII-1-4]
MTPEHTGFAFIGAKLRTNTELDQLAAEDQPTGLLYIDGRIVAIGNDDEINTAADEAGVEVRNLGGATITPGLFDSHTHPNWAAEVTAGVDLGGLDSIAAIRAALAAEHETLPEGAWLRGWNLEYEPFEESGMLGSLLEDAAPGRPIALICYDLHTALGTAPALAAAGIDAAREFDDSSEIVVDEAGVPTGELREPSAYQLLFAAAPKASEAEQRDALRDMFRKLAATGLTGGAIMDGNEPTVELLAQLDQRGELDHRVTVHHWHGVGDTDEDIARVIAGKDRAGKLWQTGAIKLFSDGVIDTGTAWLHEVDAMGDGRAAFWPSWERFEHVVRSYHDAGMLIATHAVGDYAVSRVLQVYAALPEREGLPFHSIEHLEVLADDDVEALRGSGVTASMQPLHMQWREAEGSDNWAIRLGEERAATGYRVRDALNAGARLVLGSDWPVAQYDPRLGMAWARGRHTPGDSSAHVFEPEQQLTGEEALLAYTLWPALARGHEERGKLAVGADADLTIWASDPVLASADELPTLPIVMTVVDGRIVHELG